ncbi:MAG: cellulose biosynthesis cyclic di-GMP-binding regulatory protein BcsB [Sporolactobacillus sp.]
MKYGSKIILMFLIVTVVFVISGHVSDAKNPTDTLPDTYTYQLATNNSDSTFLDINDDKTFSFSVMPYWQVSTTQIQLDYKASQIAHSAASEVTLSLNGHPFFSFHPKAAPTVSTNVQSISTLVPSRYLHRGSNTLRISSNMEEHKTNQICKTDKSNDWLTIYKTSLLRISYQKTVFQNSIQHFFERFSGVDTRSLNENRIAVSEKSANAELTAASYSLTGLAKIPSVYPNVANHRLGISRWKDMKTKRQDWIVLFSLYQNIPTAIKNKITYPDASSMKTAALMQSVNLQNRHLLVVTASDPKLLIKAGRMLANRQLITQLTRSRTIVTRDSAINSVGKMTKKRQKLVSSSETLTGPFHQERTFYLSLPNDEQLAGGSKIHLLLKYSKNLDFDRSLVTVSINGVPIGSQKLQSDLANKDSINFEIPSDVKVSGNFSVTVGFDLEMQGGKCIPLGSKTPWALISPTSYVQLYTKDQQNMLFQNYPFPFITNGELNQIAVVLPQKRNAEVLNTVSNVLSLLAANSQTNLGRISFVSDQQINEKALKQDNIITIGSYANNSLVRKLNPKLFIRYTKDGSGFLSNEKKIIEPDYGKQIGTLQFIRSPFNSNRAILVVTAPHAVDMERISGKLTSQAHLNSIYGDGVYLDRNNHAQSNRYKKVIRLEQTSFSWFNDLKSQKNFVPLLLIVGLLVLTLLAAVALFVWKYRKGEGNDNHEKK